MFRFCLFYALSGLSSQALAVEKDPVVLLPELPSFELLKLLMMLVLVIGIFLACVWMVRKLGQLQPQSGRMMQVLGGVSLGSKERLVLLQVGDEQIVVGVAPGCIQKIHTLAKPLETPVVKPVEVPNFLKLLKTQQRCAQTQDTRNKHEA